MSLERFDHLEREARSLRERQRRLHPASREWLRLELQIAGCFMLQAEA